MKCIKLKNGEVIRIKEKRDGRMKVSKAKIEFPVDCPKECPEKGKPKLFYQRQGNFCYRCPIFSCRGKFPIVEPEEYREDWAREWKKWFASGMKGLPNLILKE